MKRAVRTALLFAALAAGCRQEEKAEAPPRPIRVHIEPVSTGSITEMLDATGEIDALTTLRVASPMAGRITMLASRPGDRLPAHAVAARVLPLEIDAALRGFEVLRESDRDDGGRAPDRRRLARELAAHDVPIRVPFAAIVSERARNPGEQVAQGDVLLDVFDPRSLVAVAQVPADRAAGLVGMPAEISGAGFRSAGKVDALIPAVSNQTLTVGARISMESPPAVPLRHAPIACRITVARHDGAVVLPRTALLTPLVGDSVEVMVAKDGHAERRKVSVGLKSDSVVEALDGISAGELLISQGGYALADGASVEPEPSAQKE